MALSHMKTSPPHAECLCTDHLIKTRMTPLRALLLRTKWNNIFRLFIQLNPRGQKLCYLSMFSIEVLMFPQKMLALCCDAARTYYKVQLT